MVTALAKYMVHWAGLKHSQQTQQFHEWYQQAKYHRQCRGSRDPRVYMIPFLATAQPPIDPHGPLLDCLCQSGLQRVLNVGKKKLASAQKMPGAAHGSIGRVGRESNRAKPHLETYQSLKDFFEGYLKEMSTPFAMRLVREATGTTTRDDGVDAVALPPHMRKRQCYEVWCWQRGRRVIRSKPATSTYSKLDDYEDRPHDDEAALPEWPTGSTPKPVLCFSAFLRYWDKNYSNMKIREKGADVSGDDLPLSGTKRKAKNC